MPHIFHIADRRDWERAAADGLYRGPTLDAEGFIHCSTAEQVVRSADKHHRGRSGLVLLHIDPDRLGSPLRHEASPSTGELFPHIHGPLDAGAVTRVEPFEPGPDGRFALPQGWATTGAS